MAQIPEDAQRLADRLRIAADEIESAARFGVPIPSCITVGGHQYSGASFAATEHEFAAWVEYTEASAEHYEYAGDPWSSADSDCNGLPLRFSVKHAPAEVSA